MEYRDNLETTRLVTRFIVPADVEVWTEYCSDPIATAYTAIAGKSPRGMAEFVIEKTLARYAAGNGGLQALIRKDTGEFIGKCGLLIQQFGDRQEMEVGYHLLRRHWGKGYATEAAQMFRDLGFHQYPVNSIVSFIHPQNIASQNVAQRNGMTLTETDVECFGGKHHIYRITREEWMRLKPATP
jgi:[ribosomal protein S5]-alanine N-acetyltransferase